jgi:hypothetical protein
MAMTVVGLTTAMVLLAPTPPSARAQDVSARERQSAAEAYDRGTAAYLSRDYESAAHWFETAHRLAPAAAALVQAVRAYERAGNDLRAATLGLRLEALYPDDRAAERTARRALRDASRIFRVDVECEGCTVQLDGAVMEHPSFFVEPDTDHAVEAAFDTGSRRETVRGAAGEQRTLRFEAPPPPPPEVIAQEDETDEPSSVVRAPDAETPVASSSNVVPLGVTIAAIVATAALGGVLIWSGVDTLDGVPAYEANPTPEALADGQSREARTNWLIAGTSVLAATTLVLMIFTDWASGGAPPTEQQISFGVSLDASGGMAGLRGRF